MPPPPRGLLPPPGGTLPKIWQLALGNKYHEESRQMYSRSSSRAVSCVNLLLWVEFRDCFVALTRFSSFFISQSFLFLFSSASNVTVCRWRQLEGFYYTPHRSELWLFCKKWERITHRLLRSSLYVSNWIGSKSKFSWHFPVFAKSDRALKYGRIWISSYQ